MYRIAVVTPYYKESTEILRQCHDSVRSQTYPADHFMIADGFPNAEAQTWKVKHVALPCGHADNGNTPRQIGSTLADAEGYDFIAYLDADNWFHPNHLQSLIAVYEETKAQVCASFRTYHAWDGRQIHVVEADEEKLAHIDTSCFLIHRDAFPALSVWGKMPRRLSPICDRVFFAALKKERYKIASSRQRTVAFRSQYAFHYEAAGLPLPESYKARDCLFPSFEYMRTKEGVDDCFHRLGFWPQTFITA